jgi:hypothetical protein
MKRKERDLEWDELIKRETRWLCISCIDFLSWALSIMKMLLLHVQCPYGTAILRQAHPYYIYISITVSLRHMVVISGAYKSKKIWHLYVTILCCSQSGEREIEKEKEYHLSLSVRMYIYIFNWYTRSRLPAYDLFELMSVPVPLSYFYRSYMYECMIIFVFKIIYSIKCRQYSYFVL